MAYKKYKSALTLRIVALFLSLTALAYGIEIGNHYGIAASSLLTVILIYLLNKFLVRRFVEMDDFFESVKYRDFSRWFNDKTGPNDIKELHKGFNNVIKTIKQINSEKEAQHQYLQKILEMVDTAIIAYNTASGEVLLMNTAFKELLNVPSFKRVSFLEMRKPEIYQEIFEVNHNDSDTITLNNGTEKTITLISSTIFTIDETYYKLIAIQNIDETIDQTESEAWKKLLSVMTHEIMNSIAPISSLAETLQDHVRLSLSNPQDHQLDIDDLDAGIESIKKRSEGLMMFAKTYRSLHKITQLNLNTVSVYKLFENIKNLMLPSLNNKSIELTFNLENPDLLIDIDAYLIEQVLINLILNAIEASEGQKNIKISVGASQNTKGNTVIQVSDNGSGIPEEIIDKVFVPFFTTKKTGSGVGLSLAKQIMLLHKGKIKINSKEGKGTVISLIF
ncbi:MAG: HAMP domain-containing sensor histidine kinase [Aquaticitalea sp.]